MLRVIALLAISAASLAAPRIDAANQVPNEQPGYCVWCSLESIARQRQIAPLIGLKKMRKDAGLPARVGPDAVEHQLGSLGVRFKQAMPGTKDYSFIQKALAADRPVAIGLTSPNGKHMVVLTDLAQDTATLVDSEVPGGVVIIRRGDFDRLWDGWAIDIEP